MIDPIKMQGFVEFSRPEDWFCKRCKANRGASLVHETGVVISNLPSTCHDITRCAGEATEMAWVVLAEHALPAPVTNPSSQR